MPPWWERTGTKKARSKKREKEAARSHGGRPTPASGALWYRKGDVDAGIFLIEDKYTDAGSYRLTREVLEKVEREAGIGKVPVLRLGIQGRNYLVLREDDCLFLRRGANDRRGKKGTPS